MSSVTKTPAQRKEAAENLVRFRETAQAVESGKYEIDEAVVARAAKSAYEACLKVLRVDKNADTKEWRSLSYQSHACWACVARAVLESALTPPRSENRRSGGSGVPHNDVGAGRLQHRVRKAKAKVPGVRNRGA